MGRSTTDPASRRALRRHRVPTWWSDAKVGIFIHWTPASVPGYAPTDADPAALMRTGHANPLAWSPYTEWYENSLRFAGSPVAEYHREHHGDRPYAAFAEEYRAGLASWDPADWADRFARAGARYVVLVAKHHDGFCLWPSEVANPHVAGWNTGRDVVGELADAVRARGLRFGLYYSGGLDWTFDPHPIGTFADLLTAVPRSEEYSDYAEAQVRELVARYRPSVLWNDIAWPFGGHRLRQLFADYYAAVPDGLVNDRWMPRSALWSLVDTAPGRALVNRVAAGASKDGIVPPKPPHFDVRTPEYTSFDEIAAVPWECCRGMDHSFGYNRTSQPDDFIGRDELLGSLSDIVAKGGNLLLNVGPRGEDAQIPDEQQRRLDWLGDWLDAAGSAIGGSRPWVRPEGLSPQGHHLRFTASGDDVNVVVLDGPRDRVTVPGVVPGVAGGVRLAAGDDLRWQLADGGAGTDVELGSAADWAPWPLVLTISGGEARPVAGRAATSTSKGST